MEENERTERGSAQLEPSPPRQAQGGRNGVCHFPGARAGTAEKAPSIRPCRAVLCIPLQCQPAGPGVGMDTGVFCSGSGMRCRIPCLSLGMLWKAGESKDELLRSSSVILARRHPVTLRRSAGRLLAGRNETLREQLAGKSSESFSAAVTGHYQHAHVCASARASWRAGHMSECACLCVRGCSLLRRASGEQLCIHASRRWNLHFFGQKKAVSGGAG